MKKANSLTVLRLLRKLKLIRKNRKQNKKQPENRKKLSLENSNVYSFDGLLAWKFFKILDTNELRYLIKSRNLPDGDYEFLEPIWDSYLSKFDKINGEAKFKNSILDRLSDIEEWNEIGMMNICYELMLIGDERVLGLLSEYFGIEFTDINTDTISKARSILTRKKNRFEIMLLEQHTGDAGEDNTFESSLVQMSSILKIQLNRNILTITEWLMYSQQCKKIIEAENGRSNKTK